MKNNLDIKNKIRLLTLKSTFDSNDLDGAVPSIRFCDGPCGIRQGLVEQSEGSVAHCYPAPSVVANSWDRKIAYDIGKAISSDCAENNIDVILGPGINIKRTPLCGRNFEYFSEDPYLTSALAIEYIKGVQDNHIGTSLKHFCANNREFDRCFQSSDVDYRTLREIYTRAFENIIENVKPYTVMCSYNPINGINCAENKWVLKNILRDALGFDGVIISDWGACRDRAKALKASLDLMCGYSESGITVLEKAVNEGKVTEQELDESVDRILKLLEKIVEDRKLRKILSNDERRSIAINGAIKGGVLLKNENNTLPIKKGSIALIGDLCENPDYCGGGSASVLVPENISKLTEELKKCLPESEINYSWTYGHTTCMSVIGENIRTSYIQGALGKAYDSDYTILVAGNSMLRETESVDRTTIKLAPQFEHLINLVAKKTDKLIVVLETGSVVDMSSWIDNVQAVLLVGYAGEGINEAISRLISGKDNPSGRISETYPIHIEDSAIGDYMGNGYYDKYREGVMVGYRYYCTNNIPVQFPFGYGLSYSNFSYSNFICNKINEIEYEVKVTVTNNSKIDGEEVVELYVKNIDMAVERPSIELRDFAKVYIKAGESADVTFTTNAKYFEYFNICKNSFTIDNGRYEICINKNARDVIFSKRINISLDE